MWNRAQLKDRAKAVLRESYWKAFLVSLILLFISGRGGMSFKFGNPSGEQLFSSADSWLSLPYILMMLGALLSVSVVLILIAVFVFYPLEIGVRHYFLESTQMRFNLENVTRGFSNGHYMNVVLTMLLRGVYNFLWYLLLIIPGIVKSYSYSMVPYILSENPRISSNRAIEMSMQMTSEHKWEMFILDLSFMGWFLLGSLAFGIGSVFVLPYYNTTHAQLYVALRAISLDRQIIFLQELES